MIVRLVDTNNKSDLKKFIQLPFDLYRNNSCWVPQLRSDTRSIMDRTSHPFYQHSDADFFIAEDNGKILGRIAAISNNRFNKANHQSAAFFYFFESIDDVTVSNKLFETVFYWTKARSLTHIYGPKGLLQGDGIGLLVKGFDYIPAVGISYNFPYYDKLVKQAGFHKKYDYFSGFVDTTVGLTDKVKRVAEKVKKRRGFWVRKFETKDEKSKNDADSGLENLKPRMKFFQLLPNCGEFTMPLSPDLKVLARSRKMKSSSLQNGCYHLRTLV